MAINIKRYKYRFASFYSVLENLYTCYSNIVIQPINNYYKQSHKKTYNFAISTNFLHSMLDFQFYKYSNWFQAQSYFIPDIPNVFSFYEMFELLQSSKAALFDYNLPEPFIISNTAQMISPLE